MSSKKDDFSVEAMKAMAEMSRAFRVAGCVGWAARYEPKMPGTSIDGYEGAIPEALRALSWRIRKELPLAEVLIAQTEETYLMNVFVPVADCNAFIGAWNADGESVPIPWQL